MAFRGLFVGIDRYASPDINWLSCARRDAIGLHALFSDTLGDGGVLLTDADATAASIQAEFEDLSRCDPDDFVVVAFSGHGSDTHELATYDCDPKNLAASAIPLKTLTDWFSRIPARRVVCILDCCFSGGMGAKVLRAGLLPRSLPSVANLLDQLSGEGRLVLTASTATEEAWENQRFGHGLLTHFLLEALQGAEEVRQAGKISVYRLLEYVTERVSTAAEQLGKPQHPTLRGQMDGALSWPRFTPGPLYQAAFPEYAEAKATAEIQSLGAYGFPQALLAAWAGAIPTLNQLQIDAINDFSLLRGDHLVVSAPTSSGKTMIGELAALKGAIGRRRAFFLLPLKALVNDKHQHFARIYGDFGLRTIRATGEITDDIPALMRGQYDICLMTYEKFAALVIGAPHLLSQVGTVVIDEVQMIADQSRGANLEFLLTLLRMRRREGLEPQLVALSAVIGDTNGLEAWLAARLLRRNDRPVPLDEGVLRADGSFRFIAATGDEQVLSGHIQRQYGKDTSQDWVIPLVRRLVKEGKQVIVFREQRGQARGCALYLARELGLAPAQTAIEALPTGDPSDASIALRTALAGGVAFHISDLDRTERQVIEQEFRRSGTTLRVIAATTTLAMGVNTPAEAVVIVGLEHPPDPTPYSVAEYKNMVGRAGRLGFAERGTSYLLALSPRDEEYYWSRYVRGVPEDIESRFVSRDTDVRSLIIRVLVAAQRSARQALSADDAIEFLEGSFGAFQERRRAENWVWDRDRLAEALADLEAHKMIEPDKAGRYHVTPLGRLSGESGVEVESITRLVDALADIEPEAITDPTLIAATQLTVELDGVLFPLNKKSTQKEPQTWPSELRRQGVASSVLRALHRNVADQHDPTLRAKKAAACLLWITEWPLAKIEGVLTQFGGALGGAAGQIRAVAARTCDLLPTTLRVAELLHPGLDLGHRGVRLLTRVEVGVPAEAADLAAQVGSRLDRGDYQALVKAGLCAMEAIEAAPDDALLGCLGQNPEKVGEVRWAVERHRKQENEAVAMTPLLPPYEA